MKLDWKDKKSAQLHLKEHQIQRFLFSEGSLTQLIQNNCSGFFNVQVLSETHNKAMDDEATLLSINIDESCFIRKSLLKNDEQTLVYARTVIPEKTLTGNEELTTLGDKPLGDVLFSDESTYRSEIRYAKIPVDCEIYSEATKGLNITSELWGRQSLLYIEQKPLLITEIFLPAILECNKN